MGRIFRCGAGPLFCAFLFSVSAKGTAQYYYGTASCTDADLKATIHFYQAPHNTRVVALEYRKITDGFCAFTPIDGQGRPEEIFGGLKKGDLIHSSIRWTTYDACSRIVALPFLAPPVPNPLQFIDSWTLVPPACTPLQEERYSGGAFVPDWKPDGTNEKPLPSPPVISTDKQSYYAFERTEVHVKLTDRPATTATCPPLIEEVRDSKGNTSFSELADPAYGCHRVNSYTRPWAGPANEFLLPFSGSVNYGVDELGDETLTVYQVADPTPYGELRLVASNSITVKVIPTPHDCLPGELTPTLRFYSRPDRTTIVALDYRNTSDSACYFRPIQLIEPVRDPTQYLAIGPGGIVHSTMRLGSYANGIAAPCGHLSFPARDPNPTTTVTSPALIPVPCGNLADRYQPGPFVPDWKPEQTKTAPLPRAPVLIAPKNTYDQGESIDLRIKRTNAQDGQCPVLFEIVGNAQGEELREIKVGNVNNQTRGCQPLTRWGGKWLGSPHEFPVSLQGIGVEDPDRPGQRTVMVSELAGLGPDGRQRLLSSNALTLKIIDPATIPRTWGIAEKGIRVDLTLDKLTYALGDDIPLHMAIENLSASEPVLSTTLEEGPCSHDYTVKVERPDGSPPEHFPMLSLVNGQPGSR